MPGMRRSPAWGSAVPKCQDCPQATQQLGAHPHPEGVCKGVSSAGRRLTVWARDAGRLMVWSATWCVGCAAISGPGLGLGMGLGAEPGLFHVVCGFAEQTSNPPVSQMAALSFSEHYIAAQVNLSFCSTG
eukprot:TRINITY_DN1287_c0_g1_i1.p2 TRINITY_DN1287_c0_g1~~TRINITY_DN1287_c0_g1_i1.p2  ORF type:complete len:130 (-),score=1.86 TRINITY_DN1287_c0_g1_i1:98-487(-)